MDKPKRKKPEWEKHKTVYFNTQHPEDAEIYDYIQKVASRNFSAYMKRLALEDMQRRVQIARSPFDGTPLTAETIPVTIKQPELPPTQLQVTPVVEERKAEITREQMLKVIEEAKKNISEQVKEEEIPVIPEPKVEKPIVKEEPVKVEVEQEEQQEESTGFDFLDNAADLFGRRREE